MTLVALGAKRRDSGGLEHLDDPREFELVCDGKCDDREGVERPKAFVAQGWVVDGAATGIVVIEDTLACHFRLGLDHLVDLQVAERAHAHGVWRRVCQRHGKGGALLEPPALEEQAFSNQVS